jgi:hypothetical protein
MKNFLFFVEDKILSTSTRSLASEQRSAAQPRDVK